MCGGRNRTGHHTLTHYGFVFSAVPLCLGLLRVLHAAPTNQGQQASFGGSRIEAIYAYPRCEVTASNGSYPHSLRYALPGPA